MKYDPHESARRVAKFAKSEEQEDFFFVLNQRLQELDIPVITDSRVDLLPIIYIVGAPRSGTTLLSQLVSRHLPVGYISNLIARFWLRPSIGIRLSQALFTDEVQKELALHSTHGTTDGVVDPHEFGYFWRYWLKLDQAQTHHLPAEMLSTVDAAGLKHALEAEILAVFNRPVVFKNVICGFHAEFLTQLHPLSLFVYISRDFHATAASILKVRQERFGSYQTWWSLKPSTYPFAVPSGDPVAEVVMQVKECQREIEQELSRPGVHSMCVTYERLCADPRQVMNEICAQLAKMGCVVQPWLNDYALLTIAPKTILPAELAGRLRACLEIPGSSNGVSS